MNKDASDDTGNLNTATESICPKGWTLPTVKQIDTNRDVANFSSVVGGQYNNGTLNDETTRGYWWGSGTNSGPGRYRLGYTNGFFTSNGIRYNGNYIRCVSEEKTVTDLTYLQDMTGEIILILQ